MAASVLRATLPERVLGSLGTIKACLKAATGPTDLRTTSITFWTISSEVLVDPGEENIQE